MPTVIDPNGLNNEWIFRVRQPAHPPALRAIVLIHGWTGDENSMEIFASSLPDNCLQIFPRGPIHSPGGGFGWVPALDGSFPDLEQFRAVCAQFLDALEGSLKSQTAPNGLLDLVGFSQGAAMCYALALLYPQRFQRVAALAGFIPDLPAHFNLGGAKNLAFFIAHGSEDETIPVELARRSVRILSEAGVPVDYCESEAGHKLAAQCFKRLKVFLNNP